MNDLFTMWAALLKADKARDWGYGWRIIYMMEARRGALKNV